MLEWVTSVQRATDQSWNGPLWALPLVKTPQSLGQKKADYSPSNYRNTLYIPYNGDFKVSGPGVLSGSLAGGNGRRFINWDFRGTACSQISSRFHCQVFICKPKPNPNLSPSTTPLKTHFQTWCIFQTTRTVYSHISHFTKPSQNIK